MTNKTIIMFWTKCCCDRTQGHNAKNARIESKSILVCHCVALSVDAWDDAMHCKVLHNIYCEPGLNNSSFTIIEQCSCHVSTFSILTITKIFMTWYCNVTLSCIPAPQLWGALGNMLHCSSGWQSILCCWLEALGNVLRLHYSGWQSLFVLPVVYSCGRLQCA